MRIGIDGRYAEGNLVGIGKYIQNLTSGLIRKGGECVIFYSKTPKIRIPKTKSVILQSSNRYFWEQVLLPLGLRKERIDVYHAAGNAGVPLLCPVPVAMTIHDIIPLESKNYFSFSKFPIISKNSYKFRLLTSCLKAKRIITDSNYTRKKLIGKFKVSFKKITTIPLGVEEGKSGKLPKVLEGNKFILNHGGIDRRKNLERLLEAFAVIKKDFPKIKLVITGENREDLKKLKVLTKKLGIGNSVLFSGHVDEKTLWSLIKKASCICYPSLEEGFGIPILEGFVAGTPVISSNTSSIPEVSEDAALLVNPKNTEEISDAVFKVLSDRKLAKSLIAKGFRRVKNYKWENTVQKTLEIYKKMLG